MFNRTAPPAPETTGHDLLAEFDAAAAQFRATLAAIFLNRLRSISPDDVVPEIAPEPEA
jgi:hypothetical protein